MSKKKSSTAINDEKKKVINLYNTLVNIQKAFFYATDKITETLIKTSKKFII